MTKPKSCSGFSLVETLLILVVVVVIGFTGWFVWHSRAAVNKNYQQANASSPVVSKQPRPVSGASPVSSVATPQTKSTNTPPAPQPIRVTSVIMPDPKVVTNSVCAGPGNGIPCGMLDLCILTAYVVLSRSIVNLTLSQDPTIVYDLLEINSDTGQTTYLSRGTKEQLANLPGPVSNSYQLQFLNNWGYPSLSVSNSRRWQLNITSPNQISGQTINTNTCYRQGY